MNFVFRSEIVLDLVAIVSTEEDVGSYMSNQNLLTSLNSLSLHLISALWVNMIQDPDTVSIRSSGGDECDLVLR